MIKKMGTVAVEPKWDGVRVQIHYDSGLRTQDVRVKTFSRNLENTTAMFPELENIGRQLNTDEVILDSEAVGMDPATGTLIPFQETMTRKRKHGIAEQSASVPLKFFVFDILYKDGKDLLNNPLSERRRVLEHTVKKGETLVISPQIVTDSAEEVRRYHDEQLRKGLEGAVVKKWNSPYEPGRRGYSWVKFKEEEGKTGKLTDTIDAVVMGYYKGEGKRAGFGIGAFLVGVRQGESFVTVTKIGTGVSDELWKDIRRQLNKLKVSQKPKEYAEVNKIFIPDVWVTPQLVVEIAGDDLTKSPSHGAGVAVRFPRLVMIRTDKSPAQITTIDELNDMYEKQGGIK
jgi:DNA ligase-1